MTKNADDNVIPFPSQSRLQTVNFGFVTPLDGMRIDAECSGGIHYFEAPPGKCKCGQETWDTTWEPTHP